MSFNALSLGAKTPTWDINQDTRSFSDKTSPLVDWPELSSRINYVNTLLYWYCLCLSLVTFVYIDTVLHTKYVLYEHEIYVMYYLFLHLKHGNFYQYKYNIYIIVF